MSNIAYVPAPQFNKVVRHLGKLIQNPQSTLGDLEYYMRTHIHLQIDANKGTMICRAIDGYRLYEDTISANADESFSCSINVPRLAAKMPIVEIKQEDGFAYVRFDDVKFDTPQKPMDVDAVFERMAGMSSGIQRKVAINPQYLKDAAASFPNKSVCILTTGDSCSPVILSSKDNDLKRYVLPVRSLSLEREEGQ